MKLTKAAIDAMKFEGKDAKAKDVRWDDRVPGFGVRIWPSGVKTFVFKYRVAGRQRYHTLGKYGALTPDQALKMATLKAAAVLQGQDPQTDRKSAREAKTVAEAAKDYIERYARHHNKGWARDQYRLDHYVVPVLGTMKVASVKRADVARLINRIGEKHKATANRVLITVQSMFNQAKEFGFLGENAPNPGHGIQKFYIAARDRFVTPAELPALVKALDQRQNVYVQAAIWLYLLTGVRKFELLGLRWKDVDLNRGELCFRDPKNRRTHYLPMSTPVRMILDRLPQEATNPYVFPGHKKGTHLVNIDRPWREMRKDAGLDDVHLHDLRRTLGSWLAESGASLPLIGKVLNHSSPSVTQIYARFQQDPVARALEDHGRRLREVAGGHGSSLLPSLPSDDG